MIVATILAGGQATRMGGGDKTLLPLAGEPMLHRLVRTLSLDHAVVIISANGDPARFGLPCQVVPDAFTDQGPLAGILSGLLWADRLGAEAVLTVPGDTPLIPPGLAAALGPAPSTAESAGRRHHLVALWPVSAAIPLWRWLDRGGPRSVRAFAGTLGMRPVAFPSDQGDPFANVNTPADLAALESRVQAGMGRASLPHRFVRNTTP